MNSKWQAIELCFGIATGLVAVLNPVSLFQVEHTFNTVLDKEAVAGLFGLLLMFIGPGLLVAIGSYLHALQEKTIGFVLIMIGGSILVLEFPILIIGSFGAYGLVYTQGLAPALYMLLPSPLAALTMIAAFLVRRSLRYR